MTRVLLLIPTTSYKTDDFLRAAERLGVQVVVGTDRRQALEGEAPGHTLAFDPCDLDGSVALIREVAADARAVIGVDDETSVLATAAAASLGLPHNPLDAVRATRDKHRFRRRLAAAGHHGPGFRCVALSEDPAELATGVEYPAVLKPLALSAGRGVIRVDDHEEFVDAFERIRRILDDPEVRRLKGPSREVLIERYLPGVEVAVEGLLEAGDLTVLALFDKPDPLEGPYFEETMLIAPSRLPVSLQRAVIDETTRGCRSLGLSHGPVHAELRITDGRPWLVEIAARTIGGICSRSLRFGSGISLEELVLRQALGLERLPSTSDEATGVMMLPIPRAGVLRGIAGIELASRVPGIVELTITAHLGERLVPLPEGHRYLGFLFARAGSSAEVEQALRTAHGLLDFRIDPEGRRPAHRVGTG